MNQPLVSILIPAYNAESTIEETLRSAVAQTWTRTEIIVVDDGSTDRTAEVADRFATRGVKIISRENGGLSAAVNTAYRCCQGDYIQELDADDILAPDKIERQLASLRPGDGKRVLFSSPWAHFYFRTNRVRFVPTALWRDLPPTEWLYRKMSQNLHMQNATWLVSREVADAAGPWDETLQYDQDGEYFLRVLLASSGTRFVPEGRVFYRVSSSNRISYIGNSNKKKDSLLRSMKVHVRALRSLEDSERVRKGCLTYLQTWFSAFYPDRPDIVAVLQNLASELGGVLHDPKINWKYRWIQSTFGYQTASSAQQYLLETKSSLARNWDKAMYAIGSRQQVAAR